MHALPTCYSLSSRKVVHHMPYPAPIYLVHPSEEPPLSQTGQNATAFAAPLPGKLFQLGLVPVAVIRPVGAWVVDSVMHQPLLVE